MFCPWILWMERSLTMVCLWTLRMSPGRVDKCGIPTQHSKTGNTTSIFPQRTRPIYSESGLPSVIILKVPSSPRIIRSSEVTASIRLYLKMKMESNTCISGASGEDNYSDTGTTGPRKAEKSLLMVIRHFALKLP